MRITDMTVHDVRFPTSQTLAGSDAMNPEPDYSAAYVILETDGDHRGHGLTFTIGRGTEVVTAAAEALRRHIVGLELSSITDEMGSFWRAITGDSPLRWIGPEKGAIHMATGAIVNAVWDLWARDRGLPLWKLVVSLSPEELVNCLDLRYLASALSTGEAIQILHDRADGKERRVEELERDGYPAYITSAGWLGYSPEKVEEELHLAMDSGWDAFKIKVGGAVESDRTRVAAVREIIGPENRLMVDANQVWEVDEAIDRTLDLAEFDIYWMEEPTSPDDIVGHRQIADAIRPHGIRVATGEHAHSRVMFKQFLQENAIDVVQVDACRVGGLNEVLATLFMAAKFEKPVCPHAGGVGLCEYVQHISMLDYASISGQLEGRMTEYASHLHEHFADPVHTAGGRYLAPSQPGFSVELLAESLDRYQFPHGKEWSE